MQGGAGREGASEEKERQAAQRAARTAKKEARRSARGAGRRAQRVPEGAAGCAPAAAEFLYGSCIGQLGSFGNHILQFAFARALSDAHGLKLVCPPWLGERVFAGGCGDSPHSPATVGSGVGLDPANEALARAQSPSLGDLLEEPSWAHEVGAPEVGGLLLRLPLETQLCIIVGSVLGGFLGMANESLRALPSAQRENTLKKFDQAFEDIAAS